MRTQSLLASVVALRCTRIALRLSASLALSLPVALPLALSVALPAALLGACASTHAEAPAAVGVPARVRVVSYRSGQAFELVNESHSDRVELYSQKRGSAETKVQTDEVLDELLVQMRRSGFFDLAEPGAAPAAGGAALTRAIEVETPQGSWHLVIGAGTDADTLKVFEPCFAGFLDLYNRTYQLQSVDPARGGLAAPRSR